MTELLQARFKGILWEIYDDDDICYDDLKVLLLIEMKCAIHISVAKIQETYFQTKYALDLVSKSANYRNSGIRGITHLARGEQRETKGSSLL